MTESLSKLTEWVAQFWDHVRWWAIVDQFEGGVIFRWGKYNRTIYPGWNWKWPLMEVEKTVHTVITTTNLSPQTLTTQDGKGIVISVIVKYQIKDVKPYFCEIWNTQDVLRDVTMGVVKNTVMTRNYDELTHADLDKALTEAVRKEVNDYGFKIHKVTCTDLALARSIRVIGLEEMRFQHLISKE